MRFLLPALFAALLVLTGVLKLTEWWADAWWFAALDQGASWWRLSAWRAGAFLFFGGLWISLLGAHLGLAWRHALMWRPWRDEIGQSQSTPDGPLSSAPLPAGALPSRAESEMSSVVSSIAPGYQWLTRFLILGGALVAGSAAANRIDLWMLAAYGAPWNVSEPVSGRDIGFFVFWFPAFEWAWSWFGVALGFATLAVLFLYLSTETLETGPRLLRAPREVSAHLGALGALILIWLALRLAIIEIGAPIVEGWSASALHGPLDWRFVTPARVAGAIACLLGAVAVFFVARAGRGRTALSMGAGAAISALLLPLLAPGFGASLDPDIEAQEREVVARHLALTRSQWGFSDAPGSPMHRGTLALEANELETAVPRSIRASVTSAPTDPTAAPASGAPLGAGPAVDRLGQAPGDYEPAGAALWTASTLRVALEDQWRAAASEADRTRPWRWVETVHSSRDARGEPVVRALVHDRASRVAAPVRVLEARTGRAGDLLWNSVALVDNVLLHESLEAGRGALAPAPGDRVPAPAPLWRTSMRGQGAVARDGFVACFVLATRFLSPALLAPGPGVTWRLSPLERLAALAPFVEWSGARPRPLLTSGAGGERLIFVVEGALISRHFPGVASLRAPDAWRGVNYARPNVVGVCDAITGQSRLFVLAPDPLSRAWSRALPGLLEPLESMPPGLREVVWPSPAHLSAVAQIAAVYHPLSPGTGDPDEVAAWKRGGGTWRPLFAGLSGTSPWRYINLDGADPASATPNDAPNPGAWALALDGAARGGGLARGGEISALLVGEPRPDQPRELSDSAAPPDISPLSEGALWRWRFFLPAAPLRLPALALDEGMRGTEGRLETTHVTFWGRREAGAVSELWVARARAVRSTPPSPEVSAPDLPTSQNDPAVPSPTTTPGPLAETSESVLASEARDDANQAEPAALWRLEAEVVSSAPVAQIAVESGTELHTRLGELRELWLQLRAARATGNWSEAARLESQLDAHLRPTPQHR